MALTPAQRWRAQQLAEHNATLSKAAGGSPYGAPQGSEYELMMAALAEHRRALSNIKGKEEKAAYKLKAMQDFDGWIDGVLNTGAGGADPLFMEMLVWHMDAGLFERAIEMATYALKHKLIMPDQFNRALPEFLMDEFAFAYDRQHMPENAAELLAKVMEITQGIDTHDQPKAKLLKAHAYALIGCRPNSVEFKDCKFSAEDGQVALAELKRALEFDEKVGVKKDIEKLEAALAALNKEAKAEAEAQAKKATKPAAKKTTKKR